MLTSAYPFQRRMDLRQQSVGDPDGLAGHTVVEAHDHLQLSDRPVLAVDGPQCVRHRVGRVRDDERVLRDCLGPPG